jgi:invasion protein IalB
MRTSTAWFLVRLIVLALLSPAIASAQVPAPQSDTLPGGASSLQETHGDWSVACAQPSGKKLCTFSQQQMDKDTRQRIIAIELNAASAGRAEGTLLLPFGLAVSRDVILQLGERVLGSPLPFRTCLPAGCIVALAFDERTVADLRVAEALTVRATGDGGQAVAFRLSLKGFSSALDRTTALSKQ